MYVIFRPSNNHVTLIDFQGPNQLLLANPDPLTSFPDLLSTS